MKPLTLPSKLLYAFNKKPLPGTLHTHKNEEKKCKILWLQLKLKKEEIANEIKWDNRKIAFGFVRNSPFYNIASKREKSLFNEKM